MRDFVAYRAVLVCFVLGALLTTGPPAAAVDYDCDDFATSQEAQDYYTSQPGDPSDLDRDNDGYACDYGPPSGEQELEQDDSGASTTDAGDPTWWPVLLLVGGPSLFMFWPRASRHVASEIPAAARLADRPMPRMVTTEPEPGYNLYIRLRSRFFTHDHLETIASYLAQTPRPRDEVLRSLAEVAHAKDDATVVELASALLAGDTADHDRGAAAGRVQPPASPSPAAPAADLPDVASRVSRPQAEEPRTPAHLDPYWQPRRRPNEKPETSIRKLWEHHSRHQLSTSRKRDFFRRPEVAWLAGPGRGPVRPRRTYRQDVDRQASERAPDARGLGQGRRSGDRRRRAARAAASGSTPRRRGGTRRARPTRHCAGDEVRQLWARDRRQR